jgi:hypothetical protein
MRVASLSWTLRRALLGFAILTVLIGTLAWLTYVSIDPKLDAAQTAVLAPSPAR